METILSFGKMCQSGVGTCRYIFSFQVHQIDQSLLGFVQPQESEILSIKYGQTL